MVMGTIVCAPNTVRPKCTFWGYYINYTNSEQVTLNIEMLRCVILWISLGAFSGHTCAIPRALYPHADSQ